MKRLRFIFLFISLFLLSSCSVQKQISPEIFIERLRKETSVLSVDYESGYYLDGSYYNFLSYKNLCDIVLKADVTENQTIKKVSLSAENSKETFELINLIVKIYSSEEKLDEVMTQLKTDGENFRYFFGKRHTYSLVITSENIYFEVFNNVLSDYTVPELTLKPNDKTAF